MNGLENFLASCSRCSLKLLVETRNGFVKIVRKLAKFRIIENMIEIRKGLQTVEYVSDKANKKVNRFSSLKASCSTSRSCLLLRMLKVGVI